MSKPYKPPQTRAERREAARETAKLLVRQMPKPKGFRWDYTLGCIGAGLTVVIVLFPPQDRLSMGLWLSVLFAVLVYPTLHLVQWALPVKQRIISHSLGFAILIGGIAFIGINKWPTLPYYRALSSAEVTRFIDILKSQQEAREILRIRCPIAREDVRDRH
jgi:hypothetical protein